MDIVGFTSDGDVSNANTVKRVVFDGLLTEGYIDIETHKELCANYAIMLTKKSSIFRRFFSPKKDEGQHFYFSKVVNSPVTMEDKNAS